MILNSTPASLRHRAIIGQVPVTVHWSLFTGHCSLVTDEQGGGQQLAEGERRSAFSLIEVLVATALLVMIVGMIGFVFRQSSMSWDSGIRRAEGTTQVRAVVGAIERDLRQAVDAREFGKTQMFSGTTMRFVALSEPELSAQGNLTDDRVPMEITYTGGSAVTRKATRLVCNGGKSWSAGSTDTATLMESDANAEIDISFDAVYGDDNKGLPAYVTISAELSTEEQFSGLKVVCYGRDGKEGTHDDIIVQ